MNCSNCGTEYQVVFLGQKSEKVKRVSTMSDEQRRARWNRSPDRS